MSTTVSAVHSRKGFFGAMEYRGWSKSAIETAVSTLNSITAMPPKPPQPQATTESPKVGAQVKVNQGVSAGLLIKKAPPVFTLWRRRNAHIQGTVRLSAVINKNGDIADLEILDGPIELVVSAVNAVRNGNTARTC